jgi:hypothetical protein
MGLLGLGLGLSQGCGSRAPEEAPVESMPRRRLGKSNVELPILMFGGIDLLPSSRLLLHQALLQDVTAWESAESYGGGNSERSMGSYIESFPESRSRLFLLTKSAAISKAGLDASLAQSLERLHTEWIDLFLLHGLSQPEELRPELLDWAESARQSGKIRLFGFSTHLGMEGMLRAAAETDGIDAVLTTCNHRLLKNAGMREALGACARKGVGLIAMKTQGESSLGATDLQDQELQRHFLSRGYTLHQARLKAVWAEPFISSVVCKMTNTRMLAENVAAARNRSALTRADTERLDAWAEASRSTWCAGCGGCVQASRLPIPDLMRCLMYRRGYGDLEGARALFASIAPKLPHRDDDERLRLAEIACPNGLPIAEALRRARLLFGHTSRET